MVSPEDCEQYLWPFDLNVCEDHFVCLLRYLATLVLDLRENYIQGTKVDLTYITEAAHRLFIHEVVVIGTARSIKDLTPKQNVCVTTAVRDLDSAVEEGKP